MKSSQPEFDASASLSSQVLSRKHNIYTYLGEYGKCSKISNTLKLRTPKIIAENNF